MTRRRDAQIAAYKAEHTSRCSTCGERCQHDDVACQFCVKALQLDEFMLALGGPAGRRLEPWQVIVFSKWLRIEAAK